MVNWKEIHPDFTPELQKEWEEKGFNYEKCKEWINTGLQTDDADYAQWLNIIKPESADCLLNNSENLREKYEKYLEGVKNGSKLSLETIEQVKDFKCSCDDYGNLTWTPEQELLLDELIPNQELKERYKKNGLCSECQQPNTGKRWCQPCNTQHFAQNFPNWTSGNAEIDKFVQQYQLKAAHRGKILEWIPYERLINIEFLATGGFGTVYKAQWVDGRIDHWNIENNNWKRGKNNTIVLKSLANFQAFLQELTYHKLVSDLNKFIRVVPCFGLSQNPQTKNYLMVMGYMNGGNLRQYLQNNYKKLSFDDKLGRLKDIAEGLEIIHQQGLMHRDFHVGNILNRQWGDNYDGSYITDLGLSKSAQEANKESEKVYGVLPYVAPEVLKNQPYVQVSDIYSFGIIMYEVLSGLPPYVVYNEKENIYKETSHDINLVLEICQGVRPQFQIKIPQLLEDLINRCWDTDPENRPTANELSNALSNWHNEIKSERNDTEFVQQVHEAEKFNQALPKEIRFPNYEKNSEAVYHSKLINTKQIMKLSQNPKIAEQPLGSKNIELDINDFNLDELNLSDDNNEQLVQVEILPKGNN